MERCRLQYDLYALNFDSEFGTKDFFLELNLTDETLSFVDLSGWGRSGGGVANRGLLQKGIFLGATAYTQTINDSFDGSGQHFEPGVWANVPATTNPSEAASIVRMVLPLTAPRSICRAKPLQRRRRNLRLRALPPSGLAVLMTGRRTLSIFRRRPLQRRATRARRSATSPGVDATAVDEPEPLPFAGDRQSDHAGHNGACDPVR